MTELNQELRNLELQLVAIAASCHEANRQWCLYNGDESQPAWEDAPEWQRTSAFNGVLFNLTNIGAPASASHDSWLRQKEQEGWVYGEVKDAEKRTHPCMVPFEQLSREQQFKDQLFSSIVKAHAQYIDAQTFYEYLEASIAAGTLQSTPLES